MKIAVVAATTADQLLSACRSARAQASFVVGLIHQSIEEAAHTASLPGLEADLLVAGHVASDEPPSAESRLVKAPIPVIRIQSKGRSLARIDLFHGGRNEQFNLQNSEAESQREIRAIEERIALMKRELNAPGLSERLEQLKEQRLNELVTAREALASRSTVIPRDRNTFSVRFIPLESTLPRAPQATAQVEAYDRDVGLLNLAWAHEYGKDCPTPISGQASFVGNPVCRECHEESFPIWERSKHSRAYQTLAHKGKQYDLDCVGCHVTGFGKPGGVCRVDRVEGRQGVGCESCHGPGSQHSDNPTRDNILAAPRQPGCIGCHNPENSTHFDFDTYLPAILGPGHGLPKLKERQLQR